MFSLLTIVYGWFLKLYKAGYIMFDDIQKDTLGDKLYMLSTYSVRVYCAIAQWFDVCLVSVVL